MKKLNSLAAVLTAGAILLSALPGSAKADEEQDRRKASLFGGSASRSGTLASLSENSSEIVVKTKISASQLTKKFGVKLLATPEVLKEQGIFAVKVPKSKNFKSVLSDMKNSSSITSAEENMKGEGKGFGYTLPNDPYLNNQWHLSKIGMPVLWKNYSLKNKVKVAVVDSGVDATQPDLSGQLLKGYDFYSKDSNPNDTLGHGTAVAGVIAAKANNGVGVAGVNPLAQIIPIRVSASKSINSVDALAGLSYAIKSGAKVINLSYGFPAPNSIEFDIIYEAYRKGIVVVAASGNDGKSVNYPAGYPTVISVGSTGKNDAVSKFSSYGGALDLVAPGENIATTMMNKRYGIGSGTSFSAPIVTGVASLVLSAAPNLNPIEVEYLLEKGAAKLSSSKNGWSTKAGFGRVDAARTFQTDFPSIKNDSGNVRSKARKVTLNKAYSDRYDYSGDSDWYSLKVTKNMKVRVDVSGVTNIDSDVWMDQYANGKSVSPVQYDRAKISGKESFTRTLKPGTYYFEVYDANNHWSQQNYSFKVTALDTTAPKTPIVYKVKSRDLIIKGKAEKNSSLLLKKGSSVLAKGTASSTGTFSVKLKTRQAKGTVLYLTAADKSGNKSKATKIVVQP
ncbi:Subtilase family protein [Bacillus sp. OV322]|uniref:S8 family serine peptidase n=1 Tax=Bacillus sp. OV322 TaxID=1882764 RepID=UPI0008E608D4|nr:S8 family serine peptidase [Bacillus sp. OV322]SFC23162.1 Subtilase family protein [Bacillus sp. OV322]